MTTHELRTPRFILVRDGPGWGVGRHVATIEGVPIYGLTEYFKMIADAAAWVAEQEEQP